MSDIFLYILSAIILIPALLVFATHFAEKRFNAKVRAEVKDMFSAAAGREGRLVQEQDIAHLPAPVQRWLRTAGVLGRERSTSIRLKQRGHFRLKPDREWMPFVAEEYYTVNPPAFLWKTSMQAAPLFRIIGRDLYTGGKGNMLIKPLGLFAAVDAEGPELSQGGLLRYLNETMWFPDAVLSDYIRWEAIDERSARATMECGGISASAVFYFDAQGMLENFQAERYMEQNGSYTLEQWSTPLRSFGEFHGRRIPTEGEAVWHLENGDFAYVRITLVAIDYNVPDIY